MPLSPNLTKDSKFTATSVESVVTITYKVVDENFPHGSISLNNSEENNDSEGFAAGVVTETFKPQLGETPKGATATPDTSTDYKYDFINWTKVGSDVTYTTQSFVPEVDPSIGFYVDATYIVHFAAPKALVTNEGNDRATMRFVYDDNEYTDYTNLVTKFAVKNTNLDMDEMINSEFPAWFTISRDPVSGDLISAPTPIVNPTKVVFDPSFKDFKGLTGTAM